MSDLISKKNGLPIRRGVILIAGPDNPHDPGHWWYHVVNPGIGAVLDMNNNVMHLRADEMVDYWVCEWRSLPLQDWWPEFKNGLGEDELYMSGICAGCEDHRF